MIPYQYHMVMAQMLCTPNGDADARKACRLISIYDLPCVLCGTAVGSQCPEEPWGILHARCSRNRVGFKDSALCDTLEA